MAVSTANFALLLKIAKEPSSDKRRELLRQITDMFLTNPGGHTAVSYAAFDEIAGTVIADFTSEVRSELARTLTQTSLPLRNTARQLAMDDIEIARPVLEGWNALTEADLIDVVQTKSQEHMIALIKRSEIGEKVSSALVAHGEDRVVTALLSNKGAAIDRETYEKVTERCQSNTVLHAPLVRRQGVPLDLLNDLYASVAVELRQEILKQYEGVSSQELDAALERSRSRVSKLYGALPADIEVAERQLRMLERAGDLKPALLVRLMRDGSKSRTLYLLAVAKLTDTDYEVISRIMDVRDVDALALLCRAAGFDRGLFVALSLSVAGDHHMMSKLDEFGALYERVPVMTAQRAVRFWKLRAKAVASN